jgi:FkbM family methyltransferase
MSESRLGKSLKKMANRSFRRMGYTVIRQPEAPHIITAKERLWVIESFGIDTVLSVGASNGSDDLELRRQGFKGRIVSFEPLKKAFGLLKANRGEDGEWVILNHALGSEEGKAVINVANNSHSSSLLDMLPAHSETSPHANYIGREDITIKRLDGIIDDITTPDARVMLKIDTQGFEKNVLDGAAVSLGRIYVIEMEMSLLPLYQGETLIAGMISHLDELGFQIYRITEEFSDPKTGQMMQVNGTFVRKSLPGVKS